MKSKKGFRLAKFVPSHLSSRWEKTESLPVCQALFLGLSMLCSLNHYVNIANQVLYCGCSVAKSVLYYSQLIDGEH